MRCRFPRKSDEFPRNPKQTLSPLIYHRPEKGTAFAGGASRFCCSGLSFKTDSIGPQNLLTRNRRRCFCGENLLFIDSLLLCCRNMLGPLTDTDTMGAAFCKMPRKGAITEGFAASDLLFGPERRLRVQEKAAVIVLLRGTTSPEVRFGIGDLQKGTLNVTALPFLS